MQVVSPKSWLPLASLGSLVVVVSLSIYGRIPITVEGRGVLIYPRSCAASVKAQGSFAWMSRLGCLKGEVLATVDQVDLRKQLTNSRQTSPTLGAGSQR